MQYRHTLTAYGEPVAQMTLTSDGSGNPVETMHYLLADHLGSVDTIVDDAGAVAPHQSFDAFGKRRDASKWLGAVTSTDRIADRSVTHRGFTGHEELDNLDGLVHANGRVFDANIGRFLSVDPVYQAPTNSQSVNPYSYVMNNPLSLVDPSGYASACPDGSKDSCPDEIYKGKNAGNDNGHQTGSMIGGHTTGISGGDAAELGKQQATTRAWGQAIFGGVKLFGGDLFGNGKEPGQNTTAPSENNASGLANQGSTSQRKSIKSQTQDGGGGFDFTTGLVGGILNEVVQDALQFSGFTNAEKIQIFNAPDSASGNFGKDLAPAAMILATGGNPEAAEGAVSTVFRGKAPEILGGKIAESGFLNSVLDYLKSGYKEVSSGRFVSEDGLRQVRFGAHETRSGGEMHGHFEAYDKANGKVIETTTVKIYPDDGGP